VEGRPSGVFPDEKSFYGVAEQARRAYYDAVSEIKKKIPVYSNPRCEKLRRGVMSSFDAAKARIIVRKYVSYATRCEFSKNGAANFGDLMRFYDGGI
jgi:hypothetical protein